MVPTVLIGTGTYCLYTILWYRLLVLELELELLELQYVHIYMYGTYLPIVCNNITSSCLDTVGTGCMYYYVHIYSFWFTGCNNIFTVRVDTNCRNMATSRSPEQLARPPQSAAPPPLHAC